MPLASNPLLQSTTLAASKTNAANSVAKAAGSGKDDSSSFSDVYAKQAQAKSAANNDVPVKPARDKSVPAKDKDVASKDPAAKDDAAVDQTTVAESGNTLPADAAADTGDKDAKPDDDTVVALPVETPALEVALDPALDPALQAMVQPVVVAVKDAPVADPAAVPAANVALLAASSATPSVSVASGVDSTDDASFDPEADPLAGLPALQFALENASAKAQAAAQQGNGSNHADKAGKSSGNDSADSVQNLANNLTALADQLPTDEASTESSDKSFSGLLDDGLKDVKSTGGDTRMDNFADRLAAMSQAAQAPRAALTPVPLINQPLAMHQSGWSEGVVDRVMYLSSQNLKSAEIQLEPAELGRLDIRVNMATDQQTQVTFMSAHVGVREALENQMSRLRESFSQQGLGQVDVNVSDQNRGWQQQQQQNQDQASNSQRSSGTNGSSGGVEGSGDDLQVDASVPVSQPAARVIGSSEVDYYA